jgi:hypothetical protein
VANDYREYLADDELEFMEALDTWLSEHRKWDKHPHWQQHHDAYQLLMDRGAHNALSELGEYATTEPYDGAYQAAADTDLEPLMELLWADIQRDAILKGITNGK